MLKSESTNSIEGEGRVERKMVLKCVFLFNQNQLLSGLIWNYTERFVLIYS